MLVFISYSHIDGDFVQRLTTLLENKKIPYFLDKKDIDWGDSILDEVMKGLDNATHLIVVISPASLKSFWVPYEIGLARAKGLKILPLLTHPSLDLPGFISHLSYKVFLDDLDSYFDESIRRRSTFKLVLKAGHMTPLIKHSKKLKGQFGINYLDPESDEPPIDQLPYFELAVTNIGTDQASIKVPIVQFCKLQYIPGNNNGCEKISFMIREGETSGRLRPQGTKKFQSVCFPACIVAKGFLDGNIERIFIEDDQGFVSEVSNTHMVEAASYCRRFFGNVDLKKLLDLYTDSS